MDMRENIPLPIMGRKRNLYHDQAFIEVLIMKIYLKILQDEPLRCSSYSLVGMQGIDYGSPIH